MQKSNKLKIINDPVYGFINIPDALIFDIMEHPYFQRLRRISQMGLSQLVFPGATHTRFHHALGAMHITQKAVRILQRKHIEISPIEEQGLYIAILLHDIGHGPFSHAMEHSIISDVKHENISLSVMHALNIEFEGKLTTAIEIFTNQYKKKFLHQLISSQLDTDRLDYLKRDSMYSGVAEGNINSERILQMINVVDNQIVIEEKGLYSIEKFLMARRLMYWQCYLHKTSVVAEILLSKLLKRAKELYAQNIEVPCSKRLHYFLANKIDESNFNQEALGHFMHLDDTDIINSAKDWLTHSDKILAFLSKAILYRNLLSIKEVSVENLDEMNSNKRMEFQNNLNIKEDILEYLVFPVFLQNQAYHKTENPIYIYTKSGVIKSFTDMPDMQHIEQLSRIQTKHYLCYPKDVECLK